MSKRVIRRKSDGQNGYLSEINEFLLDLLSFFISFFEPYLVVSKISGWRKGFPESEVESFAEKVLVSDQLLLFQLEVAYESLLFS